MKSPNLEVLSSFKEELTIWTSSMFAWHIVIWNRDSIWDDVFK